MNIINKIAQVTLGVVMTACGVTTVVVCGKVVKDIVQGKPSPLLTITKKTVIQLDVPATGLRVSKEV